MINRRGYNSLNSAENQNNELEENINTEKAKVKESIEEIFAELKSSNWKDYYQVLCKIPEKINC